MSDSSKDFYQLVRSSRTYRRFDASRPVTQDQVRDLLETARLAPTGNNTQLLRYRIVTSPDEVRHVEESHGWAAALKDFDGPADASEMPTAYLAICVKKGMEKNPLRLIDCGIAAQTVCLAAAARGLACCMIKSFKPALAEELGLDAMGYAIVLLVALGYPAADEKIVIEEAKAGEDLAYWREGSTHHVPKLDVDDLLI